MIAADWNHAARGSNWPAKPKGGGCCITTPHIRRALGQLSCSWFSMCSGRVSGKLTDRWAAELATDRRSLSYRKFGEQHAKQSRSESISRVVFQVCSYALPKLLSFDFVFFPLLPFQPPFSLSRTPSPVFPLPCRPRYPMTAGAGHAAIKLHLSTQRCRL